MKILIDKVIDDFGMDNIDPSYINNPVKEITHFYKGGFTCIVEINRKLARNLNIKFSVLATVCCCDDNGYPL